MQILKLDGLCKQYPAFRLENVSFSMEAGTIMGLIGRNGAGKTTTLKSMLHLVHPDAGTVTICGLDMDKDEREIRSRIGFVSGGASYYQRKRLRELTDVTKRFYPGWDDGRYARLVPAVFARREQAHLRAVGGHEGQVSAGGRHVAPGGAADPRRADVRARPCLA